MNIEVKNLDRIINRLNAYASGFDKKIEMLLTRLSTLGAFRARYDFSNAMYAGNNDVEISVEKDGDGYVIRAFGESVLFIEFGTGVINPEHPLSAQFGYAHGTYGKGKGADPQGWVYKGEQGNAGVPVGGKNDVFRTKGNPPARAMWNAAKDMRQQIYDIAKEVFGS